MTDKLVATFLPEVRQSERSAVRHPQIEARRLGPCPPGDALLAVAAHARQAEPDLDRIAAGRAPSGTKVGALVGSLFSVARDRVADFLVTAEQSYRGTLLGMRHGFDVVTQLRTAAVAEGDPDVVGWCDRWLAVREPLIRAVAEQMRWFVEHPERARRGAKRSP